MTVINEDQAAGHIHGICLKTGPPRRVGVELEWLVRDARDPALPVTAERIAAAVASFAAAPSPSPSLSATTAPTASPATVPHASTVTPASTVLASTVPANLVPANLVSPASAVTPAGTVLPTSAVPGVLPSGALLTAEPGGQLELSSLPADSLADCVRTTTADSSALRAAVADAGLELAGIGLDPYRPPMRVLNLPRYAAMEAFFDADGPWGREMMCATASVQVCLDAGDDSDGFTGYRHRWRLLHAIGPVLVAAFANSPLRGGRPTGWRSSRQQVWSHMDPGRTRPPNGHSGAPGSGPAHREAAGADPRAEWAAYALDAQVMCVRDGDTGDWGAPPGLTLRDWVRGRPGVSRPAGPAGTRDGTAANGGSALRPPTTEDLAYHLTTLFPPVRPRGHFELRMIDAQPGDGWVVPLAVATALLSDEAAGDAALTAATALWGGRGSGRPSGGNGDPWLRAAVSGPSDPGIARASRTCFAAARAALDRMAAPATVTAAVDDFTDRYVSKDRCPADDLLEEAR